MTPRSKDLKISVQGASKVIVDYCEGGGNCNAGSTPDFQRQSRVDAVMGPALLRLLEPYCLATSPPVLTPFHCEDQHGRKERIEVEGWLAGFVELSWSLHDGGVRMR